MAVSRNPRLQRGEASLDSTWEKQGQKLIDIQQLEMRGSGGGALAVLEGKVVRNLVRDL